MTLNHTFPSIPALALTIVLATAPPTVAAGFDHGIFGQLLARHVHDGVVDYRGLKAAEPELDRYLALLAATRTGDLDRNDQLAFFINAYNACTIKLVLKGYPGLHSIRELGNFLSPFGKKPVCHIDGALRTLDDIEHGILRPRFHDPRVHFAINCASRGCPILASTPYLGETIDRQLDEAARTFINTPSKCRVRDGGIEVSMIFKWYADDFPGGVRATILKYAEGDLKRSLANAGVDVPLKYLDYDWSLNGS